MMGHYILDDLGRPAVCDDFVKWGQFFSAPGARKVAQTAIDDTVHVSTVFLALDHGWGSSEPVLWETMIFGGEHDCWQARYTSKDAAVAGHAATVAWLRGEGPEP